MNKETEEYAAFSRDTDYEVPESYENRIPRWLLWTYILLPIWGIFTGVYYFNGSAGWLDRGYWKQLQIAANTTFPAKNQDMPGASNDREK